MINQVYVEQLQRTVHQFIRCIRDLTDAQFLTEVDGWSPRDMAAHLIGWNRAAIQDCESIRRGELPAAWNDPGEDFCKINAEFVREYHSTDAQPLVREMELSFQELAGYLYTVDPEDWPQDFGVRFAGDTVTVENNIDALIKDYDNHRGEIERWLRATTDES